MAKNGIEDTLREWHETQRERDEYREQLHAQDARCLALEEALKIANKSIESLQEQMRVYMQLAIDAMTTNRNAQEILSAGINRYTNDLMLRETRTRIASEPLKLEKHNEDLAKVRATLEEELKHLVGGGK